LQKRRFWQKMPIFAKNADFREKRRSSWKTPIFGGIQFLQT
jgi:hypothetical protein